MVVLLGAHRRAYWGSRVPKIIRMSRLKHGASKTQDKKRKQSGSSGELRVTEARSGGWFSKNRGQEDFRIRGRRMRIFMYHGTLSLRVGVLNRRKWRIETRGWPFGSDGQ